MVKVRKMDIVKGCYVRLANSGELYWYRDMSKAAQKLCAITSISESNSDPFIKIRGCDNDFHWKDVVEIITDPVLILEASAVYDKNIPLGISLTKIQKDAKSVGVASYGIRYLKQEDNHFINEVCHYSLRWTHDGDEEEEITEIVNLVGHHYNSFDKDSSDRLGFRRYITWVLNESPWASICLTKDFDQACAEGVYLDVNRNISEIVAACIAMREGHEYHHRLPMFSQMLDAGCLGNVAYLVACHVQNGARGLMITGANAGHCVLSSSMIWNKVAKFFREGYVAGKLMGMAKDHSQTEYAIYDTIAPGSRALAWGSAQPVAGNDMAKAFLNALNPKKVQDGFYERQVITPENVTHLAAFITKELT